MRQEGESRKLISTSRVEEPYIAEEAQKLRSAMLEAVQALAADVEQCKTA